MFMKKQNNMTKVYQPIVIQEADNIIEGLTLSNFFKDYGIENKTYAKQHLLDVLTEKYLDSLLGKDTDELFTEEEFTELLHNIIAGSLVYELKENGLMDSYKDLNDEEIFFLTEEGKIELKNIKSGKED